jgi:hypothetical protein
MPSVGPNDLTFNAFSFINIPDPVSFNARLYVARLYRLRAEAAAALVERQQIIELYNLFWAAQDSQQQAHLLSNDKQTAHAYETVDPFTEQLLLSQAELRELADQREGQGLQDRASDLLGSRQFHWVFVTNGLPEFHYDSNSLPLHDTNRVAQLQLRLTAIELEAAQAELAGIKLRYWPQLNIYVTGPLYISDTSARIRFGTPTTL